MFETKMFLYIFKSIEIRGSIIWNVKGTQSVEFHVLGTLREFRIGGVKTKKKLPSYRARCLQINVNIWNQTIMRARRRIRGGKYSSVTLLFPGNAILLFRTPRTGSNLCAGGRTSRVYEGFEGCRVECSRLSRHPCGETHSCLITSVLLYIKP